MTGPASRQRDLDGGVDVIYFDVGGTILTARPSVGAIYADAASRLGWQVEAARIEENFARAWKASLVRRARKGHVCDDAFLRADWRRIVIDSFAGLLPEKEAARAFDDLYDRFCGADAWSLAEGAVELFDELRGRGYRLGILSNWDRRLERTLESVGVLEYFELRVISWRVGFEKPHPRIFGHALEAAGTEPRRVLHVGDSLEWDIVPARRAGFRALWLRQPGGMPAAAGPETAAAPVAPLREISRLAQVADYVGVRSG